MSCLLPLLFSMEEVATSVCGFIWFGSAALGFWNIIPTVHYQPWSWYIALNCISQVHSKDKERPWVNIQSCLESGTASTCYFDLWIQCSHLKLSSQHPLKTRTNSCLLISKLSSSSKSFVKTLYYFDSLVWRQYSMWSADGHIAPAATFNCDTALINWAYSRVNTKLHFVGT